MQIQHAAGDAGGLLVRLVSQRTDPTTEIRWLTRTPIAHRGLHDVAAGRPENSLAAFAHACLHGFPIELDVQLTRDRRVVVFHDRALRRLTHAGGSVRHLDAARITSLRLHGSDERIPSLEDVLALVAGRVPLLIDLKPQVLSPLLERQLLAALGDYRGEVAIQSFNPRALWALHRRDGRHPAGQLSGRMPVLWSFAHPAFLGCNVEALPSRAVRRWRDRGVITLAWTVRSADQARRVMPLVDNYIFENFVPRADGGQERPCEAATDGR